MPDKARLAVIGAGWWATYTHIPALLRNPSAELVALCDANPEKLQAAASAFDIRRTYTDHRTMLAEEELDGAILAVNHVAHYEVAHACLERGLHLLIEKPMTLRAAHARHLVELAETHQCQIIIGYPVNFTPGALRARQVLRDGNLGRVEMLNGIYCSTHARLIAGDDEHERRIAAGAVHGPGTAYSRPELSGGGQGHTQITHLAGLLFFTSGLRPSRVTALMNNLGLPLDVVDGMTVQFEGGALGTIAGTGHVGDGGWRHRLLIYCEGGYVEIDESAGTTTIQAAGGPREQIGPGPRNNEWPRFAPADNLVDVVLGRAANGSPGLDGWRAVELLDAAYRSAAQDGQPVSVADLYEEPGR